MTKFEQNEMYLGIIPLNNANWENISRGIFFTSVLQLT